MTTSDFAPVQSLQSGNDQHTPAAPDGDGAPTTPQYALSKQYAHLVESPDEYRTVIAQRLAKLQDVFPQLAPEQLRQARADLAFLKAILDGDELNVAQVKAGAVWSAQL